MARLKDEVCKELNEFIRKSTDWCITELTEKEAVFVNNEGWKLEIDFEDKRIVFRKTERHIAVGVFVRFAKHKEFLEFLKSELPSKLDLLMSAVTALDGFLTALDIDRLKQ